MGKKYFCTSDIHGFFDVFHHALINAGFDENNPDHVLIVCGDIFDRGNQPLEVYKFLRNLPKERRILITGNHELLLKQLVEKEYPLDRDLHNGTVQTLYSIIGLNYEKEIQKECSRSCKIPWDDIKAKEKFLAEAKIRKEKFNKKLYHNRKLKEILKWLDSDEWVFYYELDKYIFVHAGLPVVADEEDWWLETISDDLSKNADWWHAVWVAPHRFWQKHKDEPFLKDKVLVAGHWHTSDFWSELEGVWYNVYELNPIYFSDKNPGIIGLDACTAATHGCNVLVINEDGSVEVHNHKDFD